MNSNGFRVRALTRAESDDAALRIVGRDADGDPVARDHLDAEPPHATAQLRENFVSGVDLHAVEATAVHRDDGALHINQIVFAHSGRQVVRSSGRQAIRAPSEFLTARLPDCLTPDNLSIVSFARAR